MSVLGFLALFLVAFFFLGIVVLLGWTAAYVIVLRMLLVREEERMKCLEATPLSREDEFYRALCRVAEQCSVSMPHVYIAEKLHFDALCFYHSQEPFGMRRGKIVIGRELVSFLSMEAVLGVFAHELGHRALKHGHCPATEAGDVLKMQQEIEADLFAAEHLGYEKMILSLSEAKDLCVHAREHPNDPRYTDAQRVYIVSNEDTLIGFEEHLAFCVAYLRLYALCEGKT